MKKGISFFLLSLLFIAPGCKDSKETVNEYNLVPLPNQMTPQQGRFELNKKSKLLQPVVHRRYKTLQTVSSGVWQQPPDCR